MLKKLRLNFSSLFGLLLLVLSLWAIANELHEYNYRDILNSLAVYYFLPLVLAASLLGWYEIRYSRQKNTNKKI